jgi:hypothetical protein
MRLSLVIGGLPTVVDGWSTAVPIYLLGYEPWLRMGTDAILGQSRAGINNNFIGSHFSWERKSRISNFLPGIPGTGSFFLTTWFQLRDNSNRTGGSPIHNLINNTIDQYQHDLYDQSQDGG